MATHAGGYTANVRRGDFVWLVEVPEVGRTTQARNLREVDAMARDLVAVMTGRDAADVAIAVHVELPHDVREHLRRSGELREESARSQSAAAAEVRAAARALRDAGLPVRDIGAALGVSYQRAHQLVST